MRDLFNPKPTNRFKGKGFNYIILTLASSFIFACIYFIVQKIQNPKEASKEDDDERINQTKIEPYENINKQEVFYIIDGNLSFFGWKKEAIPVPLFINLAQVSRNTKKASPSSRQANPIDSNDADPVDSSEGSIRKSINKIE